MDSDDDELNDADRSQIEPNLIPVLEQVYSRSYELINNPNPKVATLAASILSYKFRAMSTNNFTQDLVSTIFRRVILPND